MFNNKQACEDHDRVINQAEIQVEIFNSSDCKSSLSALPVMCRDGWLERKLFNTPFHHVVLTPLLGQVHLRANIAVKISS